MESLFNVIGYTDTIPKHYTNVSKEKAEEFYKKGRFYGHKVEIECIKQVIQPSPLELTRQTINA